MLKLATYVGLIKQYNTYSLVKDQCPKNNSKYAHAQYTRSLQKQFELHMFIG